MFETYEDDGVVDVAAGVQHERATVVVKEIFSLLRDLAETGPREDELKKALDRHLWSIEAMQDDADSTAGFYGLAALAGIARTPMDRHEQLARVTAEDVREAARAVFRQDRMSVVAVGLLRSSDEQRLEKQVRSFG
jgi:predicted Zn-dependent peptidase